MKLKATHHIALYTPNFTEMNKFYGETLGFPITRRWDEVGIVFYGIGSTSIELVNKEGAVTNPDPAGGWAHIALHVESVDEAYKEMVAKGVPIRLEPKDFQDVRIMFISDPDGNAVELVEDPPLK